MANIKSIRSFFTLTQIEITKILNTVSRSKVFSRPIRIFDHFLKLNQLYL